MLHVIPTSRHVTDLPAGRMTLDLARSELALDDLFGMAQRENPKRAFLFVSRVLGRHVPVAPARHREILEILAGKVRDLLGEEILGGVLVTGFAETAVGLGAGVHRELTRGLAAPHAFLPTTRHPEGHDIWFSFSEDHSHASVHHLLRPVAEPAARAAATAPVLVLVDDEATTGKTFANLVRAFREEGGRRFERVVLVTLTDWSGGILPGAIAAAAGLPVDRVSAVSLAEGSWSWEPAPGVRPGQVPTATLRLAPDGPSVAGHWRAGAPEPLPADPGAVLAATPAVRPDRAETLVIGTGEHVWRPFLFAEALEEAGEACRFLATTRSPVLQGHEIRHKISFADHYGIGIPMYLHNVDPAEWKRILLFVEREDTAGICPALAAALGTFTAVTPSGRCISFLNGKAS
ncbi:phosphoribosyltransferase family protein [Cereibacter sphaeroides]|uniref:phosphoribosyltransferase domain-containing protein n=1 Tax=Cereibacter sphaeroides TaxID=1063 RepID=UPI001F377F2C|nr:phosphoribosyltransferase domain-containing protein [Cereibacter sphaeroides]MCE6957759.1 phosphoribosyltransferase family protein [Cereibacter sphaeroides]MCE6971615.1 phosphoribosyltransferase family protein [Cereibacter sphaeroides]